MSKDKSKGKRKGVWAEAMTFSDPDSGLSVVISERVRGRSEFSAQFVHVDEFGQNRFITWPCKGAKHKLADIMFSLAAKAQEFIEEKLASLPPPDETEAKKPKPKNEKREKKARQGGLSTLAKQDAAAKGFDRGSQTERKRKRR